MNYSEMSGDRDMYSGYMPPPSSFVPGQYSHQQQHPILQHQQHSMAQHHQQTMMQNQQQQQGYHIDSYNSPYGPPLSAKQSSMHSSANAPDVGYPCPPQAHQIQDRVSPMQWTNPQLKMPPLAPMPPLSPIISTAQHHPPPLHAHIQQSMAMPQRHTSNSSPMHGITPQQIPPHPPPLSPVHILTQMSSGPQIPSAASNARGMNQVRRLSSSSEYPAHYPMSTPSPSQSHTMHYAPSVMTSSIHTLHTSQTIPVPLSNQPRQGVTNNQSQVSAPMADSPAKVRPRSRPPPYNTTGPTVSHPVKQSNFSQIQHPHSQAYQSTQQFSNLNQTYQIGDHFNSQQGNGDFFSGSKTLDRQRESCQGADPALYSTGLHLYNEMQGAKNNRPSEGTTSVGGGGGARGGRGAAANRARGRGAGRSRARGRGRGAAPPSVSLQPMQWCMQPSTDMHSFQSDIEAMQAGAVEDIVSSITSRHPNKGVIMEPSKSGSKSKESVYNIASSVGYNIASSVGSLPPSSSGQSSVPSTTATPNPMPVMPPSRAAALEAIHIKQERVEKMAKYKQKEQLTSNNPDQRSNKETSRPSVTNPSLVPPPLSSQTGSSGPIDRQVKRFNGGPLPSQPVTQSLQSSQQSSQGETNHFLNLEKDNHDSLSFLLDVTSSVEKRHQSTTPTKMNSTSDQAGSVPQVLRQNSEPSSKPMSMNIGKVGNLQRTVSCVPKIIQKAHAQSAGRNPVRQSVPTAAVASRAQQNISLENKKTMTAKERVISMWRDGQVVGRNPSLLKRSAKTSDAHQPSHQNAESGKSQNKPLAFDSEAPQQSKNDTDTSDAKKSKQAEVEEPKTITSKPKLNLCYIMFHGHKLICLKSVREKMLLLCQFQFECFPDKGMGSINNCIDRSLRVKKRPLQHQSHQDIVSYLKKNDYRIDSEVLIINLEDARRVYHYMYSIRNCVSASCVVELEQPVDLSHVIPGSRKRTFPREILGRIKRERDSTDDGSYDNDPNVASNPQIGDQDESGANIGVKKTGQAGDEDARSDKTLAYGADKACDDDDVVIVSVDESPNTIRYNGEGPKVGMLCNTLTGSVRSYLHNNEHYLVIEDLCKIFSSSDLNAALENQNVTVYSCCPEIGAFLNEISDKFSPVSSYHECLVKEKDIGLQWAGDQSENSVSVSSNQPILKQEVADTQFSCSTTNDPMSAVKTVGSPKQCTSAESDLDGSERPLQIDMGESPKARKENVFPNPLSSTSVTAVNQSNTSKPKAGTNSASISEQANNVPAVSSSPQSNSSDETLASTLVLEASTLNSNEDANPTSTETEEGQTAKRASSDKNSSKEQEIRNDAGAKGPNSACASAQKGPESNSESCRLSRRSASSSSVNSLSVSHQRRLSLGVAMQDSSLQYASKDVVTTKTTEDDINILTSTNSDPMGSPSRNDHKSNSYLRKANSQLCQLNRALIGVVHKLRKELAVTKSAKDKAEKVSKHLEDALATMTSSFPMGNSSTPIVIEEDEDVKNGIQT